MAPILERVQAELRNTKDPLRRAELEAEAAAYLARLGDFTSAERAVMQLRSEFGDGRHPRVLLWIILAEGIISLSKSPDSMAQERLVRAVLLGENLGAFDIARLASAWMVHVEFNQGKFDSMAAFARRVGRISLKRSDPADCRVALTLAAAYTYVGDEERARSWSSFGHRIAVALGDEASIAAWLYNRNVFRLTRLRLAGTVNSIDNYSYDTLLNDIQSTEVFHRLAGHASLTELIDALSARSMLCRREFAAALPKYKSLVLSGKTSASTNDLELLRLEMYLCGAHLGEVSDAENYCRSISREVVQLMSRDDCVIFWKMASDLASHLGLHELRDRMLPDLERSIREFGAEQNRLIDILSILDDLLRPEQ